MTATATTWLGTLAGTAEQLVQQLGYIGLTVVMAAEHIVPPIPSELVLPLAGFEVGRGRLDLAGAVLAATLGSLIGASVLYALARTGGRPLLLRLGPVLRIDEPALARAEQRFARHGSWLVLFGRLVPGLRSLVSLPPGLLRMPFRRYLALTAAGSLVWNFALILAGQRLGGHWRDVAPVIAAMQWPLVAIAAIVAALLVVRRRHTRRRRLADEVGGRRYAG